MDSRGKARRGCRAVGILAIFTILAVLYCVFTSWNLGRTRKFSLKDHEQRPITHFQVETIVTDEEVALQGWLVPDATLFSDAFDCRNYRVVLVDRDGEAFLLQTIMENRPELDEILGPDKKFTKGGFFASCRKDALEKEKSYMAYLAYERKDKLYYSSLREEVSP
jgi:hypothetical protein